VNWPLALVVLAVGVGLGPALDRVAQWSLREEGPGPPQPWPRRSLATGLITGAFAAVATVTVPSASLLPAWWALALVAGPIARTDLARHRIPDPLNAVAFGSGVVLLLIPGSLVDYGRAWLAALAVTAALLALALIGPSGLGMGDVKLAPALGLYLGFLGWEAVLIGVAAGFILAAVAGVALLARDAIARRAVKGALRRALPFGPFLLLGTLVGLAA
jgi:leader peptidase (prepilin peptidase)/N-methyltransferase